MSVGAWLICKMPKSPVRERKFPACNADQVLCKKAQREFLLQQRANWMKEREAALKDSGCEAQSKDTDKAAPQVSGIEGPGRGACASGTGSDK